MKMQILLALLISISAFSQNLSITAEPIGLTDQDTEVLQQEILNHFTVQRYFAGKRVRIISSEISEGRNPGSRYYLYVFNYTDNLMYQVEGPVDFHSSPKVTIVMEDLAASPEEYDEAAQLVKDDSRFKKDFQTKNLFAYEPMPSIYTDREGFQGIAKPRIILVGLNSRTNPELNKIVGVDLLTKKIHHYRNNAPANSLATRAVCGRPSAGQGSTGKGVSGSAVIEIKKDNEVLWKLTIVRPSASSGVKGSGLEIRQVYYKGQLVLNRAHTPILNVQYTNNRCGPYRDWGYAENPFNAVGTNLAPGIRQVSERPSTIIDSGNDRGNFRGVAIYQTEEKIELVTELSAGWYRYASRFELYNDGTIKPIFQFSAVSNSCVCYSHNHHVYWRFDFDINGRSNSVQLKNGTTFNPVVRELSQKRRSTSEVWRVTGEAGTAGYDVIAGPKDGIADTYAVADIWLLKYRSNEIDDARVRRTTRAALNSFVTNESLSNANLVMWYGAHFFHENDGSKHDDIFTVGPTLRPFSPEIEDPLPEEPLEPEMPE